MKKIVTTIIATLLFNSFIIPNDLESKKIGLVLSGGGVKGFGHIGTLQLIDSLNIKIDYVVGSSIGAITAALYATGHSIDEINKIGSLTNWDEIFSTTRKRNQLYYFQKQDSDKFQLSFSLKNLKPIAPISLSNGQYSYEHLSDIFINYSNVASYDNLIIPFRCNATDIITGEEIVFNKGSISKALRISTSIPTVFSPIEYKNNLLVDGGLVNNLPTNLAENLGADFIIASSVMSPEKSKDDINDIFNVVFKLINLYGKQNEKNHIAKSDILLNPNLENISLVSIDPKALEEIKKEGQQTAYKQIDKFIELAKTNPLDNNMLTLSSIIDNEITIDSILFSEDILSDSLSNELFKNNMYITKDSLINKIKKIRQSNKFNNISYKFTKSTTGNYNFHLFGENNNPIIISSIKISGNVKMSDAEILKMFSIKENSILNIIEFNNEIKTAYQSDFFHYINYDIIHEEDKLHLEISIKENPNKQIKLGALWDNHYKLIGKLKLNILNKPTNKFRIQDELLFSGFKRNKLSIYYNIHYKNNIIIIPFIAFTNSIKNIGLTDINQKLYFVKHDSYTTSLGFILPFKNYGSLTLNQNIMDNTYSSEIFNLTNNNFKFYSTVLDIDQLDNLLVPKSGFKVIANHQFNNTEDSFSYIDIKSEFYKTVNYIHTLRVFNWYKNSTNNTPIYLQSSFGGYNWASGYDEFILSGQNLNLLGAEYQFHYKNSTTIRFIINKLITINNMNNGPINWGLGIKVKSIIGPVNFMWGRGHTDPFDQESKKHNIFYFNFGVEI